MTLKELLTSVDFDKVVPYITKISPEHTTQIPYYREAFDELLHLEAIPNSGVIDIAWCREDTEPYIHVGNCEGDFWDSNLGKRLAVDADVNISREELAARCLWSLTFYGFSVESQTIFEVSTEGNKYEQQVRALRNRHTANYARLKRRDMKKEGLHPCAMTFEEWKVVHQREAHRNRMKRMRDHRQKKRIDELKRMSQVERDICRVLERTCAISREDLNYLFTTKIISPRHYHSRAYDRTQRLPYLLRSLVRYEAKEEDAAKYTHLVIVISTDPAAPITEEELGRGFDILDYILYQCPNPDAEVLWEFGTKEGLGDEAELLVLKSY